MDFGLTLLFSAFVILNITLTTGDYRNVLLSALVLGVAGNIFVACAWWRGGRLVRVLCLLSLFPTAFIVADLARRGPHAWAKVLKAASRND